MEVVYKDTAIEDIKFWKKSGQKTTQNKISRLNSKNRNRITFRLI